MNFHGESVWRLCLAVILLGFGVLGIGHMIYPDYFIQADNYEAWGRDAQ